MEDVRNHGDDHVAEQFYTGEDSSAPISVVCGCGCSADFNRCRAVSFWSELAVLDERHCRADVEWCRTRLYHGNGRVTFPRTCTDEAEDHLPQDGATVRQVVDGLASQELGPHHSIPFHRRCRVCGMACSPRRCHARCTGSPVPWVRVVVSRQRAVACPPQRATS